MPTTTNATADVSALLAEMAKAPLVPVGQEKRHVFFLSLSDASTRASTFTIISASLSDAQQRVRDTITGHTPVPCWVRIDWVERIEEQTWSRLKEQLAGIKRNYFRLGIALDPRFTHAFTEMEINANAMLYGGVSTASAALNENNFRIYARRRHDLHGIDFGDDTAIWLFRTKGAFLSTDDPAVHRLDGEGLEAGRRSIETLSPDLLLSMIASGGDYLAAQVQDDGRFLYGWHPCFDRPIASYNALRHASSLYAMIETWETTGNSRLWHAIERSLSYLTNRLIKTVPDIDGSALAFVVEENDEIKLGANAVAILALAKHSELTGDKRHADLLEQLALGILHMQDNDTGAFVHVLNYPSLTLKEKFRIIYYDGEAAFGLMRLYALTGDSRWLAAVEKAFDHFIRAKHWKAHDHWLSYCVNELTAHRPEERYYRFGIDNFRGYLDFVETRITTFPTLLELMMAAENMVTRIREDQRHAHLLTGIDLDHFHRALHKRARHLLNGHFWPELAMFFARPCRIAGSFFIRHHGFRVRIDDVEHYLSGLIAYRKYLLSERQERHPTGPIIDNATHWTAHHVAAATGGRWAVLPPPDWKAAGLCIHPPTMRAGDMVALRLNEQERGITRAALSRLRHVPAAIITSDPAAVPSGTSPVLVVENSSAAILAMGSYARRMSQAKLIGVTGSAGKTSTVAMMHHVLNAFGGAAQTRENANLPHGIAWNLSSIAWDCPHIVLEMAIGRMAQNSRMAKPDIAIFVNVLPAHLEYHGNLATIAERKSRIFEGMAEGSTAILNREMNEWSRVVAAAEKSRLKIFSYGRSPECHFQLLTHDPSTGLVTARIPGRRIEYHLKAAGEHMALNSLAVLAGTMMLGHDLDQAMTMLGSFDALPGRGRTINATIGDRRFTLIDDAYNANPGSMAAAFQVLGDTQTKGRRIAVIGEMLELGPDAPALHADLATAMGNNRIDRVYAAGALYEHFWSKLPDDRKGAYAATPDELKRVLKKDLRDDDLVLLKGSNGSQMHQLVDWIDQGAPDIAPHVAALLFDIDNDRITWQQNEDRLYPPASLTKLMTLSLIAEKLEQKPSIATEEIEISSEAVAVNSRWGFEAGERVAVHMLMEAAMVVSANEAANALAEWHSGNPGDFTAHLNERAAELGMSRTRFSSPSGLGRGQHMSVGDALTLARHVQKNHPSIARMARNKSFKWGKKIQENTNSLINTPGANGLKTGRLGSCFNLIFSKETADGNRLAIVLGARSKTERDQTILSALEL